MNAFHHFLGWYPPHSSREALTLSPCGCPHLPEEANSCPGLGRVHISKLQVFL